ncbi:sugar ABC transporter permease [Flavimobilis marinus]|uniref:Maltose/maltodextrin transport system permease protein n=1 Tax=Flavimobilis marinus TaxID=285351 RepID=A0A1I2FX31_9MICO|nr:ABC transporter permease subunit [Flavimobilis marinus]GHG51066.1 sugar ABC transporter permease [Flavimobilis marinus]SFF09066.1 carbohydrate ABC transporter membrane protein 1, CUT1 family [Flavimobilis marinus]
MSTPQQPAPAPAVAVEPGKLPPRLSHARDFRPGFLVKLIAMAVVNALGVYVAIAGFGQQQYTIAWVMVALLVLVDYVYFSRRTLPLKYLVPGLVFLFVYQIFSIGYTGYVALTNYGDGHNGSKAAAVDFLLAQNERRIEGSASYPLSVVRSDDGALGLAIVDGDTVRVGSAEEPLSEADDATVADGKITALPDWELLPRQELYANSDAITKLRVPFSDDPEEGSIRTQDGSVGYVYLPTFEYDEEADTLVDTVNGVTYFPADDGYFRSADGTTLPTGWRVFVGFENFADAFADDRYSEPFFKVLVWTFVFSIASVIITFLVGLFFAVVLNDPRVRGRKVIRSLLILPYAFPAFMAFLLWRGMLNEKNGFINQVLLGGAEINWLGDPWLAKLVVLGVQLWVGFPYMFLITTGALQSIPGDVIEAAKIDGAGAMRIWRSITGPLLLIAVAPLLISSFAFNFNNFNIIEMLTGGGPRFGDASVPIGHTDILITMVYSISGLDGGASKNYGLASALSIMIFVIVATISVISFKKTRSLEEIN